MRCPEKCNIKMFGIISLIYESLINGLLGSIAVVGSDTYAALDDQPRRHHCLYTSAPAWSQTELLHAWLAHISTACELMTEEAPLRLACFPHAHLVGFIYLFIFSRRMRASISSSGLARGARGKFTAKSVHVPVCARVNSSRSRVLSRSV